VAGVADRTGGKEAVNRTLSRLVVHPLIFKIRSEDVLAARRELETMQWWSADRLQEWQFDQFRQLYDRARRLHPFYRAHFQDVDLTPDDICDPGDLARLPMVVGEDLQELARQTLGPGPRPSGLTERRTTGSTGVPNVIYADRQTSRYSLASRYRCQGWYGSRIGDRQGRFWGRPATTSRWRERVKDELLNRVRYDSSHVTEANLEATVRHLVDDGPDLLYGYPSMMLDVADRLESMPAERARLHLKLIVTTAEASLDFERRRLSEIFGCPVANEYGCSEVDIITFECPEGSLHIMADNVLLETIPSEHVSDGSGELVVTDLRNHTMPLIRYRMGDLGVLGSGTCTCGLGLPRLERFTGRLKCNFIVTPSGDRIHTSPFAYLFEDLVSRGLPIKQFRTVQGDERTVRYFVVLDRDDEQARRTIESALVAETASVLGSGMSADVRFVDTLPPRKGVKRAMFETDVE